MSNRNGFDPGAFEEPDEKERLSQATIIVRMVNELRVQGVELWHTPEGVGYITIPINGHFEHWRIRSVKAREWIARVYYKNLRNVPGSQGVQDAITTLEGQAIHDGTEYPTSLRIAELDGVVYLDLCDADWRAVQIDADGWKVLSEPPVRFRRARGMEPLPVPTRGGNLQLLRKFIGGPIEIFILVIAWLIGAMRPRGPYPILEVSGEGSGKSTLCRMLRRLFDPNAADLRSQPRDERDLVIAANNGWCIGLDNLSSIPPWLSDALCRISTGGGFGTRELYSDNEEIIFSSQRPILVNGITELATRPDLLDRAIRVHLPKIEEENRKPESKLWTEFKALHSSTLGALLDAVSMALRHESETTPQSLPRMADFACWVVSAESAMPWKLGAFMGAYTGNRAEANDLALEASPVASMLIRWMESRQGVEWNGTASELLSNLDQFEPLKAGARRPTDWPKSARGLSGALRRVSPNLRIAGIDVELPDGPTGTGKAKRRELTVRTRTQMTVPTVPTVLDLGSGNGNPDATERSGEIATVDRSLPFPVNAVSDSDERVRNEWNGGNGQKHVGSNAWSVPAGFQPAKWADHLDQLAAQCDEMKPTQAADFRREAAAIRAAIKAEQGTQFNPTDAPNLLDQAPILEYTL